MNTEREYASPPDSREALDPAVRMEGVNKWYDA